MTVYTEPVTSPATRTLIATGATWTALAEAVRADQTRRSVSKALDAALAVATGPETARRVTLDARTAQAVLGAAGMSG